MTKAFVVDCLHRWHLINPRLCLTIAKLLINVANMETVCSVKRRSILRTRDNLKRTRNRGLKLQGRDVKRRRNVRKLWRSVYYAIVVWIRSHVPLQRARLEQLRIEAEKLAEERRLAREQAMEWTREARIESDEERERKPKKVKKPKAENVSGDEGEPKKKRRGKLKKAVSDQEEEDQPMFSEEDEVEKPAKKVRSWLLLLIWPILTINL
jgi:hypothetical protein